MEINVKSKKVIVTGGGSGLGLEIAKMFALNDAKVIICDSDEEAIIKCKKEHQNIKAVLADVGITEQIDKLFEKAEKCLGGLDILINNVGIAGPTALVENIDYEDWEKTFKINIHGPFYCSKKAIPLLKKEKNGSIINISSTAGLFSYPYRAAYSVSKWAVVGLTKTLAAELGEHGIRVNTLCPHGIESPRLDAVIKAEAKEKKVEEEFIRNNWAKQASLQKFVKPINIASMILYLCSDLGNRVSGQTIGIDGHVETLRC